MRYVTGINRLFRNAGPAYFLDCFRNRHFFAKRNILGCHNGTGRILRITENLIYLFTHSRL